MPEFDYERFVLETDFQDVLAKVKEYVFLWTDFAERKGDETVRFLQCEMKLKWPKTIRECLAFPFRLPMWLFVHFVCRIARFFPSEMDILKRRNFLQFEAEWERVEDWILLPGIREHILKAEVPDDLQDDPFIIAERIARTLLKDGGLRSDFNFGLTRRIAATAIFLADIGFDNYRRSADPDNWPPRTRPKF